VTPTEKTTPRKPGRPRKYGQGRINATVRFTADRYAALKMEAEKSGRSVSEEVEQRIERSFTNDALTEMQRELQEVLGSFDMVLDQMRELQQQHRGLQQQNAVMKHENEQLIEMIASAADRAGNGESE
jgi:hypothetical protein